MKNLQGLNIVRGVELTPRASRVRALEPQPAGCEACQHDRDLSPVVANLSPVDLAPTTLGILAAGPKKTVDDLVDHGEDRLVEDDGDE